MTDLATTLWSWAFANTVVAAVLAGCALAAARWRKHPSVAHGLWVLVLVKLVTPPLFALELPIYIEDRPLPTAGVPRTDPTPPRELVVVTAGPAVVHAPAPAPTSTSTSASTTTSTTTRTDWSRWTLVIWFLGSGLIFAVGLARAVRFHRELRHARPASAAVVRASANLADRLGLRRVPRVRVLPGRVSPMLWGLFGRPQVLLPEVLERTLSVAQQRTLLAHELAHLHRRDHWVRLLEMVVRAVHWWNPIARLACAKLREVEEECCDAWVVWALPDAQRHYADALLDTVEFLSDATNVTPAPASGVGKVQNLKRRLAMIMQGDNRKSLPRFGRLGLLTVAALALPLMPAFGQDKPSEPAPAAHTQQRNAEQKAKYLHALHQAIRLLQQNDRTSEAHTLIVLAKQISSQGRSSERRRATPRNDRGADLREHHTKLRDLETRMKQIASGIERAEKTGRHAEARALRQDLASVKEHAVRLSTVTRDLETALAHRAERAERVERARREAVANDRRVRDEEIARRNLDRAHAQRTREVDTALAQRERELHAAHEALARRAEELDRHAAELDRHAAAVRQAERRATEDDRMQRLENQVSELTQVVHRLLQSQATKERRHRVSEVEAEVEAEVKAGVEVDREQAAEHGDRKGRAGQRKRRGEPRKNRGR